MHEQTFRRALETAGLNPYLLEMANIREQCSWVHDDAAIATEKARALVHAAVSRVALHEPLERLSVDMCPNTLVIGGGIAGHDRGARAGRRRQHASTSSRSRIISAATSRASTSPRPTSTPPATS